MNKGISISKNIITVKFLFILRMRKQLYLFIVIVLSTPSCIVDRAIDYPSDIKEVEKNLVVPTNQIDKSKLTYDRFRSMWLLDGNAYSGFAITNYGEGIIKEKIGILNGKKQNKSISYFPDGSYKSISNYNKGKLHGEKKTWAQDANHLLLSHLNYHRGKVHGKQTKWYPTGELFQELNLNMGKEEGLQRAYRKNGNLYANYEAKEGRIFGLKKAALCFGLEEEKLQYER